MKPSKNDFAQNVCNRIKAALAAQHDDAEYNRLSEMENSTDLAIRLAGRIGMAEFMNRRQREIDEEALRNNE